MPALQAVITDSHLHFGINYYPVMSKLDNLLCPEVHILQQHHLKLTTQVAKEKKKTYLNAREEKIIINNNNRMKLNFILSFSFVNVYNLLSVKILRKTTFILF